LERGQLKHHHRRFNTPARIKPHWNVTPDFVPLNPVAAWANPTDLARQDFQSPSRAMVSPAKKIDSITPLRVTASTTARAAQATRRRRRCSKPCVERSGAGEQQRHDHHVAAAFFPDDGLGRFEPAVANNCRLMAKTRSRSEKRPPPSQPKLAGAEKVPDWQQKHRRQPRNGAHNDSGATCSARKFKRMAVPSNKAFRIRYRMNATTGGRSSDAPMAGRLGLIPKTTARRAQ